jgi:hypothetical protein
VNDRPCPDVAEEITPEWCTAVMWAAGSLGTDATVTAVECEPLDDVRGYFSRLFRLRLAYEPPGAGPGVAIAKLPSSEMWNRMLGFHLGFFENELRFYEHLSASVPVRVPSFHGGACDVEAQRFALLLEDVSGGRVVDQTAGCSIEDAAAALAELARIQAVWWESPALDDATWLAPLSKNGAGIAMGYDMACDGFLANFTEGLPPAAVSAVDALRGRVGELIDAMCAGPHTLVHGDFRLDNLVYPADGAEGGPLLFDWQNVARGSGFVDVAQLVALGLPPDTRRSAESDLLRGYVGGLSGAAAVSDDDALEGYRLGVALTFVLAVSQTMNFTEQKGSDVAVWIERSANAVADLGLPSALL